MVVQKFMQTAFECVKNEGDFSLLLSKGVAWNSQFLTSLTVCTPAGFLVCQEDGEAVPCGSFAWNRELKRWDVVILEGQGARMNLAPDATIFKNHVECIAALWAARHLAMAY